jgi:phospholipid/cholesterol/gamma-HCH transport system substrate-binding protein
MKDNLFETIVGAVVLIAAAVFLVFAFGQTGLGVNTAGTYRLNAEFSSVGGLEVGSDVKLAGIKVGRVANLRVNTETYVAEAVLSMEETVKLPEDTSARITTSGLLGSPYVDLEPGGSPDMLGDGDSITFTQGAVDLMNLISRAMFSGGGGDGGGGNGGSGGQP